MRYLIRLMLAFLWVVPLRAGSLYFAQIANGGGYVTTITISNPTNVSASGTLTFTESSGIPWFVTIDNAYAPQFSVSIPPMGSKRLVIDGGINLLKTGWAVLESQSDLQGVATFDYRPRSTLLDTVGVIASTPGKRFVLPIYISPVSDTGFAVANIGTSNVIVRLTLYDENGIERFSRIDSRLNSLAAKKHISMFVSEIFPKLPSTFVGSLIIEVVGAGDITTMGLCLKEGQLSSVPVALTEAASPYMLQLLIQDPID
jgi:hypothetical protein